MNILKRLFVKPFSNHNPRDILSILDTLIKAPDWSTSRLIIETYPELLTDEAIQLLCRLALKNSENKEVFDMLDEHRALLARCQEVGVEQAFNEKMRGASGPVAIPPELSAYMKRAAELEESLKEDPIESPDICLELIQILESILLHIPDDAPPKFRAAVNLRLGFAYVDMLATENHTENLQQAIAYFNDALTIFTYEDTPGEYAAAQNGMGNAYRELPIPDYRENLEHAIACYHNALKFFTIENAPDEYAAVQNNLGIAYRNLPTSRKENIENAIACHFEALRVFKADNTPREYASTQAMLGVAYRLRPAGDSDIREKDLLHSIDRYHEALRVCPQSAQGTYALIQLNLGSAYAELPTDNQIHQISNLTKAIECYGEALHFYTRERAPVYYATTQHNLGNIYQKLATADVDTDHNLELAISCYQESLQFSTPETAPFEYANTQNSLGLFYDQLRTKGQPENTSKAIAAYREALRFYTPEAHPHLCRQSSLNLGRLYCEIGNWSEARAACAVAIRSAETLYRTSNSPSGKEAEIASNVLTYRTMVQACLESSDYAEALVYIEASRTRLFLDLMGQGDFQPPSMIPQELLQKERELIARLREQERSFTHVSSLSGHTAKVLEHQATEVREKTLLLIEEVWKEIENEYPSAQNYVDARRGNKATWQDLSDLMQQLGPNTALVEFYVLPEEVIIFVLRSGWKCPRIHREPLNENELFNRYFLPYQDEMLNRRHSSKMKYNGDSTWLKLGERLLTPVDQIIGDASIVYFIPHDVLHYIPLHALTVLGEPFIVRRSVVYAPSASVLARMQVVDTSTRVEIGKNLDRALVMGYTPSNNPNERTLFEGEAQAISACLHTSPVLGEKALGSVLQERGLNAQVIHLSCHGRFCPDNPAASSVLLASGDFSVHSWLQMTLRADLVTLSGCETAISKIKEGDNLTGLSQALLWAGASSVLVTLWSVNADTTMKWMKGFYDRVWDDKVHKKTSLALAFQQTTLELREENPDPYYWAPFVLAGNGK